MKMRRWNKRYARLNHYFWLPCPLCGQEFGGHEWVAGTPDKPSSIDCGQQPGHGHGICPDCTEAGKGDKWDPDAKFSPSPCRDAHCTQVYTPQPASPAADSEHVHVCVTCAATWDGEKWVTA